jgi:hypothetical protein
MSSNLKFKWKHEISETVSILEGKRAKRNISNIS